MEIPNGSKQIQEGLYMYEQFKMIGGKGYNVRKLYSTDGYGFWQPSIDENYYFDEEGNKGDLKPESERVYSTQCQLARDYFDCNIEKINNDFISVKINFEI